MLRWSHCGFSATGWGRTLPKGKFCPGEHSAKGRTTALSWLQASSEIWLPRGQLSKTKPGGNGVGRTMENTGQTDGGKRKEGQGSLWNSFGVLKKLVMLMILDEKGNSQYDSDIHTHFPNSIFVTKKSQRDF